MQGKFRGKSVFLYYYYYFNFNFNFIFYFIFYFLFFIFYFYFLFLLSAEYGLAPFSLLKEVATQVIFPTNAVCGEDILFCDSLGGNRRLLRLRHPYLKEKRSQPRLFETQAWVSNNLFCDLNFPSLFERGRNPGYLPHKRRLWGIQPVLRPQLPLPLSPKTAFLGINCVVVKGETQKPRFWGSTVLL